MLFTKIFSRGKTQAREKLTTLKKTPLRMSTSFQQEIHESILYVEDPEALQRMSSKKEELSLDIFVKNSLKGKYFIKLVIKSS